MKTFGIHSYKRKIIWLMAILICMGILYKTVRERNLYMVYIDDKPVAVTASKPETVLQVYGDVKAKRYVQGEQETQDAITVEKINEETNMKILNKDELADTIYLVLNEQEPLLSGKSEKYFTQTVTCPAPCEYIYDGEMYEGEYEVISEGCEGTTEVTVRCAYFNGEVLTRKTIESEVVSEAESRVVHIGTKERPDYIMPVDGYVFTSGFGPRWGRNHNGIDLAVPVGTDVHAAADGVVIQSGWNDGYGISVYIDHGNGVVTRYGHMSSNDVSVGQYVEQGEYIGLSGNTGDSTGPHMHFEMRIGGEAVDPLGYAEDVVMWE